MVSGFQTGASRQSSNLSSICRTPSSRETFASHPSMPFILLTSAKVQSGSPGRLGMFTTSPSSKALLEGDVVNIPRRPGEPDCTFADVSKINGMLGWEAKVSLEEGVRQMLDRLEDWRDAPVWNPETIQQATSKWFQYLGDKITHV